MHYGTGTESRQGVLGSVMARLRGRDLWPFGGVVDDMLVARDKS